MKFQALKNLKEIFGGFKSKKYDSTERIINLDYLIS